MQTLQPSDNPPLLVHVHIHKCAGRALTDLLERSFPHSHLNAYRTEPFSSYLPEELDALLARCPRIHSISSHNIRIFPEKIGSRQALYVTFLRHPLDWFVSYLTYVQQDYAQLSPVHRQTLPDQADQLPLAELAAEVIDRHLRAPKTYSTFIRYIAESTYRHQLGRVMDMPAWEQSLEGTTATLFRERGLEMARQILERFFFVGIQERMDASLDALRARLGTAGMRLGDQPLREINVSRHRRDDLNWLNADHPTGRVARQWLQEDIALYEWAVSRLDAQFSQPPSGVAGE